MDNEEIHNACLVLSTVLRVLTLLLVSLAALFQVWVPFLLGAGVITCALGIFVDYQTRMP